MKDHLKRLEEELDRNDLNYNDTTLMQLSRYPESFEVFNDELYMKFRWNGEPELSGEGGVESLSYYLDEIKESGFLEEVTEEIKEKEPKAAIKYLSDSIDVRENRFDGKDQSDYHESNLEREMAGRIYEIIVDGKSMGKIKSIWLTSQRLLKGNIDYGDL